MRVDVGVEFYVTVLANEEGIARAAQTLGDRTFDERALCEMVEGKLVDGLRAEAAKSEALAEAENGLSASIIDFRLAKACLDAMPKIVAEMVNPAEKIGGIIIHKVEGLTGALGGGVGAAHSSGGDGLVNQAFDEMRKMAVSGVWPPPFIR
mgnify:CR=1 FL=1